MQEMNPNFWKYVDKTDSCWNWTGRINLKGYGRFSVNNTAEGRRHWRAHRYSYIVHKGQIPEGLDIDHLCENKACVNPDHLEAVEHVENVRRYHRKFTHCKRGHEYNALNTYFHKDGRRDCRLCRKERYGQSKRTVINAS